MYGGKKKRIEEGAFDIIGDFIDYRNPELAFRIFEDDFEKVETYFKNLEDQIITKDMTQIKLNNKPEFFDD